MKSCFARRNFAIRSRLFDESGNLSAMIANAYFIFEYMINIYSEQCLLTGKDDADSGAEVRESFLALGVGRPIVGVSRRCFLATYSVRNFRETAVNFFRQPQNPARFTFHFSERVHIQSTPRESSCMDCSVSCEIREAVGEYERSTVIPCMTVRIAWIAG